MKPLKNLSVPEQVILYNHFKPHDIIAMRLFGIEEAELFTVKELAKEKFAPRTVSINPSIYASEFEAAIEGYQPPKTATRTRRPRGRPGLNIIKAFASIPLNKENGVDAKQFADSHGICLSSLRQFTRFDNTGMEGRVTVKMDKNTKTLMVWRDLSDE